MLLYQQVLASDLGDARHISVTVLDLEFTRWSRVHMHRTALALGFFFGFDLCGPKPWQKPITRNSFVHVDSTTPADWALDHGGRKRMEELAESETLALSFGFGVSGRVYN